MTDEERVNRVLQVIAELGKSAFAAEGMAEYCLHETEDYPLGAWHNGKATALREACRLLREAMDGKDHSKDL